ncbi:Bro-N domain-containing protein [Pseudomonas sp. 5P_5.1_Bac1]|uniref:BRO-N domain-containing protein n=1 Tax=Pseudomonas sp. 5P_5.1_Bac1 TaxID=2971616 RepID=UPI0021C70088|nr:Bro-N domain-containing protein [Pseudomonas sp. 5P_5.1_Bac1]MCU1720221.1 Bro-N domain-containing protein [Pseudomonas sp. 5P_5.1_Bac1]
MTEFHTPTLFTRHNRPLHALWLDAQVWFCAREFGRLIGRYLDDHIVRKLDKDQHRSVQLLRYGQVTDNVMISESGAYTVLAHHYIPENRHLRRWLTHHVIAVLRDEHRGDKTTPATSVVQYGNGSMELLYWQNEAWIRLGDFADVAQHSDKTDTIRRWRAMAGRFFGG